MLKVTIAQKDHDISLLDSHATSLASGLEDAKVACTEAGDKIISLTSERDRLISEVSSLHAGFQDFKKKMEVQQEEQAQELYNRVAELEAHVMDVSGRLEGEFYPTYLTTLRTKAGPLTLVCGGFGGGMSMVSARRSPFCVKKDAGMDEVLDYLLLDGPAADFPEAVHLQPCLEQLKVPIHHAGDKTIVGETSLSFALMNVHSHTWVGEASTSVAPLSVKDYQEEDTDKALGSVVAIPQLEVPYL
ncbi:hypothetical protein Tco_0168287 [Tanacetum coccineum]